MRARALKRGTAHSDGLTVARADPLGLLKAHLRVPHRSNFIVLPRRYTLPTLALPGSRRYQPGGVALASSVGDSEEFVGLRDYRPGDPLQRIHWKSFARTARPIVKEYQDEYFERHALVLDTFAAARDERLQPPQPDRDELIEVRTGNGQKLQPLQQRQRCVAGFVQHALVEFQPTQLAVEETGFGGVSHDSRSSRPFNGSPS